ncbi:MAG: YkvA family protein [Gloeomargarita sp. DG_2_bins_126]
MNPLVGFYRWYRDTLRYSPYRWLLILGSLVYLMSPLDIAPDILPFLGWIDDGILIAILVGELTTLFQREPPQNAPNSQEGTVVDVQAQEVDEEGSSWTSGK